MTALAGPAIGVFDSGIGGLSVLREIRRALPAEHLMYVADSGHAPYGDRSEAFITGRVQAMAGFFREAGVKAIVVACNTASAVAVQWLRSQCQVPVVAIEPAIKPAAQRTRSGVIGVLATQRTVASANVLRLAAAHGGAVRILLQACPGLAERVEAGALDGAHTEALVAQYVRPLLDQGADTLVLGCTHYPYLRACIERVAGPGVEVIDPAPAVARELVRRLGAGSAASTGTEHFWTTGALDHARSVIPALWQRPAPVLPLAC